MRIAAIFWQSHVAMLARAARDVPDVTLNLWATKTLEDDADAFDRALDDLRRADAVLLYRSSEAVWTELDPHLKRLAMEKPLWSLSHDPTLWAESSLPMAMVRRAYDYVVLGGRENFARLLAFAADVAAGGDGSAVAAPASRPWEGYYHPLAPVEFFETKADFAAWHEGYLAGRDLADAPRVGMVFSRHYWVNENRAVEDAAIAALEARGLAVVPVFSHGVRDAGLGNKGTLAQAAEAFLDREGRAEIRALVKFTTFFLGQERAPDQEDGQAATSGSAFFTRLGVPVFQPVVSGAMSVGEWRASPLGLGHEIAWSVAMPEFEGVIEPLFVGAISREPGLGAPVDLRAPVPERVARLADRVRRWVDMGLAPVSERKVAFVLNNDPCASVEATVGGASKLDSLESVVRVLAAMRETGYDVEVPESGRALIDLIMSRKAVSEFRWTTVDEIVKKGGALDLVPLEVYRTWWDAFPESVRRKVTAAWGEPPGEHLHGVPPAMVHEGRIVVTGVRLGNAVVVVQPKRGCAGPRCDGRVCKILHDPDIAPPHQYLATYRWLALSFGADCVINVGTHGNLEFLPGKGVGLSESCLPDVCLNDVPHLYIYNCDNPAEGTIAKRRSYATLVDHMQTAMTHGGLYDALEELDGLLDQYEKAKSEDRARAHALEHLVVGAVRRANLATELGLDDARTDHAQDFGALAARAHEALSTLRNTLIPDGMHVFGDVPQDGRRADVMHSIVRHDGGEDHTLRKTLARLMGLELADLLADQGAVPPDFSVSAGRLLEEMDHIGKALALAVIDNTAGDDDVLALAAGLLGDKLRDPAHLPRLLPVRDRLAGIDARMAASREIPALLDAFAAGHVPAGPSGVLTRGREDILPTGRNFYSLDPRRVPTKAAAMVGRSLAEALLARFRKEEGRLPENVAVYWMANDIMWADGEGLGQIFHLIGVRPVWTPENRVETFEIVPRAELGRPRVDVTVRISGLIRDNFPDRLELLDRAIAAVAALDEPGEANFVRKHTLEKLAAKGQSPQDRAAMRRASLRLFASMPGTYQPGVNLAVYASAWKTQEDLSDIFLHWNGYAYGEGVQGEKAVTELASSLSTVEATYNKVVSDEHDLLGCCCYFGAHGGMTAAARQLSGRAVKSYYGDTREPQAVRVRDLAGEVRRVVRTKLLHPAWIEGMKRHGYKGAGDIAKRVGRVYGWEAATGEVDDWIFDDIAKTFVLDDENRAFFEKNNPWALEEIGRRLLEAANRGLWQADPEVLGDLKDRLLEVEGWLEDRMGEVTGEFQGSNVDVLTPGDVERWKAALDEMQNELRAGKA